MGDVGMSDAGYAIQVIGHARAFRPYGSEEANVQKAGENATPIIPKHDLNGRNVTVL